MIQNGQRFRSEIEQQAHRAIDVVHALGAEFGDRFGCGRFYSRCCLQFKFIVLFPVLFLFLGSILAVVLAAVCTSAIELTMRGRTR
jgi:hypothetical protein